MSTAAREPVEPGSFVLIEAVRLRAVQFAAEVLTRMPFDEVPAALRQIARFTPAKRARLGGPALAAALDADAGFRAKVADVIAEGSPQLVAAVRDGTSTAASDPIDTALVAYLTRPEGWTDTVTQANARWEAGRGQDDAAAEQLTRLRAEMAQLRTKAKGEPARLRDALQEAERATAAELADLRRQVRARGAELRAAAQELEQAQAAVADAQRRMDVAASAQEAEMRRVRARVADLERAAEVSRRGTRADRDADDVRLWLLVETLAEASAGIRRELSLPAPSARPADTIASGRAGAPSRRADDPAALDGLLALPHVHVIVDGYNVTKNGYGDLPLADQRKRLIGAMATLAARCGAEVTIAFDGGVRPPAQPPVPRGVRVLFSAAEEIADDLIRRLVAAEPEGRPIVVVTSDQQVVTDVGRAGAWTVPSAVLLARLG
ncbi:MAG: NYN domain-containing protein [Actinomycetota bacterium]|nr:NYN domain-containing protein [Actinomycetota bacterium]